MRKLVIAVSTLGALSLFACEDKPAPHVRATKTTIQHDAQPTQLAQSPNMPNAPPLDGDTSQLPPDHPNLGDGTQNRNAPGDMPNGHPPVAEDADAKALLARVEAMKDQLKDRPKSVEVTVALGSLYYDNGRYLDAVDYFRQAIEQGQPLVDAWQKIRAQAKDAKPATLAEAGCERTVIKDSDPMMKRAQELAAKKDFPKALACAAEAARPVVMAHERRGNAFYLVGNAHEAANEHAKALALDPDHAESLFFRGAILFDSQGDDLDALREAQKCWKHFLEVAPDSPRVRAVKEMLPKLEEAISLGGASKLPKPPPSEEADNPAPPMQGGPMQGSAPPLDQGAADAIEQTEITPELIDGFGKILDQATVQLAKNDVDGARTNLVRVFPFVMADVQRGPSAKIPPNVRARAQARMGLYMMGKGAPMGGMMVSQAVSADPKTVDALGDSLKSQGDATHAKQLWQAIVQGSGAYASSANVASKLQ